MEYRNNRKTISQTKHPQSVDHTCAHRQGKTYGHKGRQHIQSMDTSKNTVKYKGEHGEDKYGHNVDKVCAHRQGARGPTNASEHKSAQPPDPHDGFSSV